MEATSSMKSTKNGQAVTTPPQGVSSPCAGCKFLRRKCQPECVFAPYFPPDQPQKFINVHKVYGASNVTKILNDLKPFQREDAVNSLAYEAEMRLRFPVYGCVGVISALQNQLRKLQIDLSRARSELGKYELVVKERVDIEKVQQQQQYEQYQHHQQKMMMMRDYTTAGAVEMDFGGNINGSFDDGLMMAMTPFKCS